jgi:DNA-binding transcriptional MerR regulator
MVVVQMDEFLPGQIARAKQVSRTTIHKAERELGIVPARTGGGHRRYTPDQAGQIVEYIEQRYGPRGT